MLKKIEGILPEDDHAKTFMFHVLFETTFDIQSSFIKLCYKEAASEHAGEDVSLREPSNSNVQRQVGWAIRSMHDRLSKELTRKDNHTKAQIQLNILDKMSMSKAKATPEYEEQYYTLEDRIFDKGGLTLVHAELFPWGRAMLLEIRQKVNHHEISKLKGRVLEDAWQSLKSNKDLVNTFVTEIKKIDSDISDAALEELHEGLLLKVFHAQANFELSEFSRKKLETASGNNGSQVNFRTGLKCSSEKKRQRSKEAERGGRKRQKT